MTRHILTLAFTFFAAALSTGAARADPPALNPALDVYLTPQTLVTLPDGRHAHLFCLGHSAPTAILESGWRTPSLSWWRLEPQMAEITRVCAFDRAGYGFSDAGPLPRDSASGVADLHAALKAAKIDGPYILVGHSLGGFDARLFAYTYPNETAGLLLLDPPTENIYRRDRAPDEDLDEIRRCISISRAAPPIPDAKDGCVSRDLGSRWSKAMRARQIALDSRSAWFETLLSEDLSMVGRSADEIAAARRSLDERPVIVLQADADPKDERSVELESQARDSRCGRHQIVEGSKHYIYLDKPEVVLSAFREIVEAARKAKVAPTP
jgi:pimeloyl-ACP methyl ester carboxylesterase